jgi:hypothetical protein
VPRNDKRPFIVIFRYNAYRDVRDGVKQIEAMPEVEDGPDDVYYFSVDADADSLASMNMVWRKPS